MTEDIGSKIKIIASIIIFFGVLAGIVWFFISLTVNTAYFGLNGIISSITLIISSIISYFVLYGFGLMVENSETIAETNEEILELLQKSNKPE